MQERDVVWDDFTRGKAEYFLLMFQNPDMEFYEVGDSGLVILSHIVEGGSCEVHYIVWQQGFGLVNVRKCAVETLDYAFYKRKAHHVVGKMPVIDEQAVRFALSVGMKFEGEIREDFKYHGRYYSMHIYGLLDREYESVRGRLTS